MARLYNGAESPNRCVYCYNFGSWRFDRMCSKGTVTKGLAGNLVALI
ncbi:hypothetical protein [Coleofasciculus chthonoplastes]|nr:hypothetical protein [Coleofasciculus chthonoplastes]